MSVAGKRLEAATSALTARERAILVLRPWLAGGDADDQLRRYAPADQKAEIERVETAINIFNQNVHSALAFGAEWLWETEVRLAWLECLDAFLQLGPAPAVLQRLPSPGRGFMRSVTMVFGKTIGDDDEVPASWPEARNQLLDDVRFALQVRWGDLMAFREVREEARQLMGEEMMHAEPLAVLDQCAAAVRELQAAVERIGGPFDLGEPTEDQVEIARSYLDREALADPSSPSPSGRQWMRPLDLAELEDREARLATELRSRKELS